MKYELTELTQIARQRTEKTLSHYLQKSPSAAPMLQQSMAYAVFNGGKRLRPLLVYATAQALDCDLSEADAAAASIELIHSYSLVHDDLPAMDNADLRRGQPACHKQFGEAMGILAGDALQTLAFYVIANHPNQLSAVAKLAMVKVLSEASGLNGMAGGQALDILSLELTEKNLLKLYELKTGNLLRAAVTLGALTSPIFCSDIKTYIDSYSKNLGLAFQIQDDLLDIQGTTQQLGKPQGIDQDNTKFTYPLLMGIEKAKQKIEELITLSIDALKPLGPSSIILQELANSLLAREY